MFRIRCIELTVSLLVFGCGIAFAQDLRSNFWIGSHRFGSEQYAPLVKDAVGVRLGLMESELELNNDLRRHFRAHRVKLDKGVGTQPADLDTKYMLSADKTLVVMSGFGVNNPASIVSVVYVGPPSPKFEVEIARARLLSNADQPAGEIYMSLLFLYAMIKEADSKGLDYKTYISPLREKALSLTLQAKVAEPSTVARIRDNLLALTPPCPRGQTCD